MIKRSPRFDLLELARNAAVPHPLTNEGRHARFGDGRDQVLRRGQVWRAQWDEVTVLVLLAETSSTDVDVIPVTVDPDAADSTALVLDPSLTAFGVETTLWINLRTRLPLRVLDEIIDEFPADLMNEVIDDPQVDLPRGVRKGPPAASVFDPSKQIRAEIEDDLSDLQASPQLPVEGGSATTPPTLASILGKNVNLGALVDALGPCGLNQSDVMSVLKGKRFLTPDLVDAIASVTDISRAAIAEAVTPLPAELVEEVDHPRWRSMWRDWAHRDGLDESTARLRGTYELYALAARQTGAQKPDWAARLAQFRQLRDNPRRS
ncbi:hypothetical protein ACJH6J_22085 [Mycobacterium sp. SMC-18]|uniref:hypothetical protein n=1 Tax=Mycobacterium sp. SMC-18 TaxID=3381629 RepID=UPI003877435D